MYAEKRVVIVAAVVFVVCALLFCNAAPTVEALTPTSITITTTNTTPALNQPFTLSGYLKDNTTGAPLSGRLITLGRTDPSGHWSVVNTTTTNANGAYTFTRSESAQGTYSYTAIFSGDTHAASNASVRLTVR